THKQFPQPIILWSKLAWSRDSARLLLAAGDQVAVLEPQTGAVLEELNCPVGSLTALSFRADGAWLAMTGFEGTEIRREDTGARCVFNNLSGGFAWLPDGRRGLGGPCLNGTLTAVDVLRRRNLGVLLPHLSGQQHVCIGPDGHYRGSRKIDDLLVYVA